MANLNRRAGEKMRAFREGRGLTMREVHRLSKGIAKSLRNTDYVVSPSRLSDIESKGHTPNLYRFHALALVYDSKIAKLLKFYRI